MSTDATDAPGAGRRAKTERHGVLLRLDPAVHAALVRWADDELRSVNAQIEMMLRRSLDAAGRLPREMGPLPRRGRPTRGSVSADDGVGKVEGAELDAAEPGADA